MSRNNVIGQEVSHANQSDEVEFPVVEETPELHATVELEIQGKVDTNHPDAGVTGLTLEAEERMQAREAEIERTRRRVDRRADSGREARTRRRARAGSRKRREAFQKRAASVDEWAHPYMVDPRAQLNENELGAVNREASRVASKFEGWSRAAISRLVAKRVVSTGDVASATLEVFEELREAPGQVIPIEAVGRVDRAEVDVEGTVDVLWDASHPAIQQVGLLADETGRIKFTVWKKSRQPIVEEGERVRMRHVAKSYYRGRVSVALTGRSRVTFPERERESGW